MEIHPRRLRNLNEREAGSSFPARPPGAALPLSWESGNWSDSRWTEKVAVERLHCSHLV